eukprot:gb/GFBE01043656.1/.p1 GENE.gb/GFBE01043656.1/~~gb/GFBE01043656.1/.p1  ORF type:complete len:148 (+),score=23.31 gb/GFBE01043656.1/:1-444(+)
MVAAVCLFRVTTVASGLDEYRLYVILLADVVLFAAGCTANGIVDSIALQHAMPGTWFCQENYVIAAAVVRAAGSFLGPPCVRMLIGAGGQDGSAAGQLCLTLFCLVCLVSVRLLGAWIQSAEEDDSALRFQSDCRAASRKLLPCRDD